MIETFVDLQGLVPRAAGGALWRASTCGAHEATRAYLVELLAAMGVGARRAPGQVPLALQLADARDRRTGTRAAAPVPRRWATMRSA